MFMEEKLIERSQNGDMDAFEELVVRYERKVYAIAYRFMGNREDANDLSQEAFIKAYRNINKFRKDSSFFTWMCRIVSNVCKDELRKIKRKPQTYLDEDVWLEEGSVSKQVKDNEPTPEQAYEKVELNNYLQSLLNQLKPEYRMVIILREIEGYSYDEISELLNVSLGTVKSRISRARKALKEKIASSGKEEWL